MLPRKDTKKRFLKLMKDSGKSKTNTDAGATDTSKKKISTNERVLNFKDFLNEANVNSVIIGIDIDGTISNFEEAYNKTYKKYFPNNEVYPADEWFWYKKMDYEGADVGKWFRNIKAETFENAQPYPGAVNTVNNIYDFAKNKGYTMNIVTNQPTQEARYAATFWLNDHGFKYDDITFVDDAKDKWKFADIMVDDAEQVLGSKPIGKVAIKIEQLWNTSIEGDINIPNIKALTISVMEKAISKLVKKSVG